MQTVSFPDVFQELKLISIQYTGGLKVDIIITEANLL